MYFICILFVFKCILFVLWWMKGVAHSYDVHSTLVKVMSLSRVQLLATPWTAAPPSMGSSRQEYWSGGPLIVDP